MAKLGFAAGGSASVSAPSCKGRAMMGAFYYSAGAVKQGCGTYMTPVVRDRNHLKIHS